MGDPELEPNLASMRLHRLRSVMADRGVEALLTADPINLFYATGVRNMSVFSMMGAARFALVLLDGPVIVWEFAGAEHLAERAGTVDEVRTAPGVTALSGPHYPTACAAFANEIAACHRGPALAVERVDHPVTDALRGAGFALTSATDVFVAARVIKLSAEVDVMWAAMHRVEEAVAEMLRHLEPGRSEVEIWSHFHRHLIETGGEYVSTRLVQAGERTFPYFQEAGPHVVGARELFCIDTDAIGIGGYGADFSRTYVCGDEATRAQVTLHRLAEEQLTHNASLLAPGVSFEAFASDAWPVPDRYASYGYYCLAHGLGLSGEYPYLPLHDPDSRYPVPGEFEPGMVICVESYIGDPDHGCGVKLEDQFVITAESVQRMSTMPFDPKLSA
ncbi:MAG: M24 family metallopeptidase [Actinomycetota bacterium]